MVLMIYLMIAVSEKMTASSVKAILLMTFSIKSLFLGAMAPTEADDADAG